MQAYETHCGTVHGDCRATQPEHCAVLTAVALEAPVHELSCMHCAWVMMTPVEDWPAR